MLRLKITAKALLPSSSFGSASRSPAGPPSAVSRSLSSAAEELLAHDVAGADAIQETARSR